MSLVIAVKEDDHILVACDSQVSCGDWKDTLPVIHNKAWFIDDCPHGVMASSGSLRVLQLIQCTPNLIDEMAQYRNEVDYIYVVTELYNRICEALIHYKAISPDITPLSLPNDFIFAYKDKAYGIECDGSVVELEDYLCIGSGAGVAKGIMETTKDLPAIERIKKAMNASSDLTLYVDKNIRIYSTAEEEVYE